jgi:hypothetical protein
VEVHGARGRRLDEPASVANPVHLSRSRNPYH